jgi:pyruvate dehydrogenase E2 component (dihydrolipoamide acetyltransferase)
VPLLITIGATNKKPLVVDNEIKIRDVINITLTLDHRYTDGARAAKVYQKFIKYLDDPESCPKEESKLIK